VLVVGGEFPAQAVKLIFDGQPPGFGHPSSASAAGTGADQHQPWRRVRCHDAADIAPAALAATCWKLADWG